MVKLKINGKEQAVDVSADVPLLWVIRDHLKLTGTKYGCGIAECGACTVHCLFRSPRLSGRPAARAHGNL